MLHNLQCTRTCMLYTSTCKFSDEESAVNCESMKSFPDAMVNSLLVAMKNGSAEARQRFPRLLQIVEYYPDTINTFIKKVNIILINSSLSFYS